MSTDRDTATETDVQDDAIKFTFRQRNGVDAPGLPDEVSVVVDETIAGYIGWTVDAALERLSIENSMAGSDMDVDAEALKAALGETHYAEYVFLDHQHAYGQPAGVTTTNSFRANRPVDHDNVPFTVGDTFDTADGATLTYQDYPTDGLLFETADGWKSHIETADLPTLADIEAESEVA